MPSGARAARTPTPACRVGTHATSILSPTTGFLSEAQFTHSLTPARNCTFGCIYCYVPTMRMYAGLKPADWNHWGHFTTFKTNAPELLRKQIRDHQVIYCSPLVDPYQPAEETEQMMPRILAELIKNPPKVFVIQTRGPLIQRDLPQLIALSKKTKLRLSFSVTTNREAVRKLYEPHCATVDDRLNTIRELRDAGIPTFMTLAPILPCDPEAFAHIALEATNQDIIGDPLHVRSTKPRGATTREAAFAISEKHGFSAWLNPDFQRATVERIRLTVQTAGRQFATGPEGFRCLTQ